MITVSIFFYKVFKFIQLLLFFEKSRNDSTFHLQIIYKEIESEVEHTLGDSQWDRIIGFFYFFPNRN